MSECDVGIIRRKYVNLDSSNSLQMKKIRAQMTNVGETGGTSSPVTWPSMVYPFPRGIATNSKMRKVVQGAFRRKLRALMQTHGV